MADGRPALPSCTVVIATRNREAVLRDTIVSLLAGNRIPEEIVVVDQSAEPVELDDLRHPYYDLKVLRRDPVGVGSARNAGVEMAAHEHILSIDDDVLVEPDWLDEMLTVLAGAGEGDAVTGRVLPAEGAQRDDARAISVKTETAPQEYRGRIGIDVLFGNSMGFHRAGWAAVGGFDPRFGSGSRYRAGDDIEFGYRILEAGNAIHYVPSATLFHRSWRHGKGLRHVNWVYGFGQGAFYAKHLSLHDPHMLGRLRALLWERVVRIAARPLRSRSVWGHGDLIYSAGVVTGVCRVFFDRVTRYER